MRIVLFLPVFLAGCISYQKLVKQPPGETAALSFDALNGNYANFPVGDTTRSALWNLLSTVNAFDSDTLKDQKNITVQLECTADRLFVTGYRDSAIIGSFELEGKVRGDYFCPKRNLFLVPVPFLFFRHRERRIILGTSETGELVVKYGLEEFLWIMMAGGYDYRGSAVFRKSQG